MASARRLGPRAGGTPGVARVLRVPTEGMGMANAANEVSVVDAEDRRRFELFLDGELAAFCDYVLADGVLALTHAETLVEYRGRGLAGILTRTALDSARERGLRVRPICPYVVTYIERHRDYADLVA